MRPYRIPIFLLLLVCAGHVYAQTKSMLIFGPTAGCDSEKTPGFTVTIWDEVTWASKTTADFSAFDVIVFGDCYSCYFDGNTYLATAINTISVWAPAVTGNIGLVGSDPDYHTYTQSGAVSLIQQLIQFAADDPKPGPGLYYAVSCGYSDVTEMQLPLMGSYWPISVVGTNAGDAIHIVASHPVLDGLTDANLSNWSNSSHEGFTSWPANFIPLAITLDGPSAPYTAADGTTGLAHILVSGDLVVPVPTLTPTGTLPPTPTETFTPMDTETPTVTTTVTPTHSHTVTLTPTMTPSPTPTRTATVTSTATVTCTPTVTFTSTSSFTPTIPHTATATPIPTCFMAAWPNPFIPSMAARRTFKVGCMPPGSSLVIFTVSGERVAEEFPRGDQAEWDGRNRKGRFVSAGFYYWVVKSGDQILARGKVVVSG